MALNESDVRWKIFALTHVSYIEGDVFGKFLAISSLSPLIILVSYATLILFRRDIHTICLLCGQIANEIVNWCLKLWVQDPRPIPRGHNPEAHTRWNRFGFPSNHSQFMSFFCVYMLLFLFVRLRRSPNGRPARWKALIAFLLLANAFIVCFGRVYLEQHTWSQVLWGSALGALMAGVWFLLVQRCFTPLFPRIITWRVCEYFLVRDYSVIPNVILFEYSCARAESRTRNRKLSLKRQ